MPVLAILRERSNLNGMPAMPSWMQMKASGLHGAPFEKKVTAIGEDGGESKDRKLL